MTTTSGVGIGEDVINWNYETMYTWYNKQNIINDNDDGNRNIYAFVYESKSPSKKDKGTVESFITANMMCVGKMPIYLDEYPNGLYIVTEKNKETSRSKWLFFVYPEKKMCFDKEKEIILADHFTFCLDSSDKKNSVHFHTTTYICYKDANKEETFASSRIKDYFPDKIKINKETKKEENGNILKKHNGKIKDIIMDLMIYPWTSTAGGARKRRGRKSIDKLNHRTILSPTFNNLWDRCKFKGMIAIGIRNESDGKITWNVMFIRKERERVGQVYPAYVFTTDTADETVFQNTLAGYADVKED